MKLSNYLKTWNGALAENRFSRWLLIALVISNVLLVMLVTTVNQTVVLVPPTLEQEAEVAEHNASAGYKEAWATHVAMLLGNVTPRTAPYVSEQVGKLMGPQVYHRMMDSITEQTARIGSEQLTIQFSPTTAFYLAERDVVIVTGEYSIRGIHSAENRMLRTYEIGIDIRNYRVRVDSLNVYEGAWNPAKEQANKTS